MHVCVRLHHLPPSFLPSFPRSLHQDIDDACRLFVCRFVAPPNHSYGAPKFILLAVCLCCWLLPCASPIRTAQIVIWTAMLISSVSFANIAALLAGCDQPMEIQCAALYTVTKILRSTFCRLELVGTTDNALALSSAEPESPEVRDACTKLKETHEAIGTCRYNGSSSRCSSGRAATAAAAALQQQQQHVWGVPKRSSCTTLRMPIS